MRKFSRIVENKMYNSWSVQTLKQTLSSIPNCNVENIDNTFTFSIDSEGTEIASLDEIKMLIKSGDINEDALFSPMFIFILSFKNPESSYHHESNGVESLLWCDESLSLDYILNVYKSIENTTKDLKEDFYIYINVGDVRSGGSSFNDGKFSLEFVMKDTFDINAISFVKFIYP